MRRVVTGRQVVAAPYSETEPALQICLNDLIGRAFPSANRREYDSVAAVTTRFRPKWLRVPVVFEIETARARPGQIAHLRWHALRLSRFFPVMDADILLRPSGIGGTELVVEGRYEPPFGLLGMLGDIMIGRFVARSTLDSFVAGLGDAIQAALSKGGCRAFATSVPSEVA